MSDGEGCEIMFRVIRQRWRRVHMDFGENGNDVLCVILCGFQNCELSWVTSLELLYYEYI